MLILMMSYFVNSDQLTIQFATESSGSVHAGSSVKLCEPTFGLGLGTSIPTFVTQNGQCPGTSELFFNNGRVESAGT